MNFIFKIYISLFALFNCLLQPRLEKTFKRISIYIVGALYFLAIISSVSIVFEQQISEQIDKIYRDFMTQHIGNIESSLTDNKKPIINKDQDNILGKLDDISWQLRGIKDKLKVSENNKGYYILEYYNKISLIPKYYKMKDWEETEEHIYNSIKNELHNYVFGGGSRSGEKIDKIYQEYLDTINKERKKFKQSKWGKR